MNFHGLRQVNFTLRISFCLMHFIAGSFSFEPALPFAEAHLGRDMQPSTSNAVVRGRN
jgi:hypothetical protein